MPTSRPRGERFDGSQNHSGWYHKRGIRCVKLWKRSIRIEGGCFSVRRFNDFSLWIQKVSLELAMRTAPLKYSDLKVDVFP